MNTRKKNQKHTWKSESRNSLMKGRTHELFFVGIHVFLYLFFFFEGLTPLLLDQPFFWHYSINLGITQISGECNNLNSGIGSCYSRNSLSGNTQGSNFYIYWLWVFSKRVTQPLHRKDAYGYFISYIQTKTDTKPYKHTYKPKPPN